VLGGIVGHQLAVVDDQDSPAGGLHFGKDMGGEHYRLLPAQVADELADLHDLVGIKA